MVLFVEIWLIQFYFSAATQVSSLNEVDNLGYLPELCRHTLILMEIDPVGLVDVPAPLPMDHVTVSWVLRQLLLLSVDDIFGQVHLVSFLRLVVVDVEAGAGYRRRPCCQVAILYDVIWFERMLLVPFLVLNWGEEEVGLLVEREGDRFVCINLLLPCQTRDRRGRISECILL